MKAAVDIDGTLTAWPGVVGPLTQALAGAGWDVVLLTGHLHPDPAAADRVALMTLRRAQVARFEVAFRQIVLCVGRDVAEVAALKAAYLRDNGVGLFVDDSPPYAEAARRLSPGTLTLLVLP
jgi:hypothetical protein